MATIALAAHATSPTQTATDRASLAPRHTAWLEETEVLLWPEERRTFLGLAEDHRRDAFIARFWQLRDPDPDTSANELRERHEERLEQARREFRDLEGDRTLALLIAGPPRRRVPMRCAGLLPQLEVWLYAGREATQGRPWALVFRRRGGAGGEWNLWDGSLGLSGLAALAPRLSEEELAARVATSCRGGAILVEALDGLLDREQLLGLRPRPNPQWLQLFAERSTDLPDRALTFPAELTWEFPERIGQRIRARGTLRIPVGAVEVTTETPRGYAFLLDGELIRRERLFEDFRYRFQLPAVAARPGTLALRFERRLRPGTYRAVVRVEDLASGRFARLESNLEVPSVALRKNDDSERTTDGSAAARESVARQPVELRLVPPAPRLHTGALRLTAQVTGDPASVEFRLDEGPGMRKTRPPWSVELDLGDAPRLHRVAAVARGVDGEVIARDELLINAGPHRLAVRIVEPLPGSRHPERLHARAEVEVPIGERLDRLQFFLNERRMATLYQPPFELTMPLSGGDALAYVRAVAWLEGGSTHEDVVFVNTPEHLSQIEVHTIELYTTVTDRRGRPVEGLTANDFRIFEDDRPQEIRRFEHVRDVPFWGAVLLDTSGSMREELEEAVTTATGFFNDVLTARDRAAAFTVADDVHLVTRFTRDVEALSRGLSEVVAQGDTRLYDGILRALYEFGGLTGKRALIVITDGEDSDSRHTLDEVLDYARHTGVAIYPIGLGVDSRSIVTRRAILRLAEATGGHAFLIQGASGLRSVYRQLENEIRSQYLLVYQSSARGGDAFRAIRVELDRPALTARTIPGYTP